MTHTITPGNSAVISEGNEGNFDRTQGSTMMIQGAMGASDPYQSGGVLYIISPSNYNNAIPSLVTYSYNIPLIINESANVTVPIKSIYLSNAQIAYISSVQISGSALTFSTAQNNYYIQIFESIKAGSQMYFQNITGATWLNANSTPMAVNHFPISHFY